MNAAFLVAGGVVVVNGLVHSYAGERIILVPLLGRRDLPPLLGSEELTKRVLRAVWHFATLWWLTVAAILFALSDATLDGPGKTAMLILAVPFALMALVVLWGSRGRHLGWLAFLIIAIGMFWGAL